MRRPLRGTLKALTASYLLLALGTTAVLARSFFARDVFLCVRRGADDVWRYDRVIVSRGGIAVHHRAVLTLNVHGVRMRPPGFVPRVDDFETLWDDRLYRPGRYHLNTASKTYPTLTPDPQAYNHFIALLGFQWASGDVRSPFCHEFVSVRSITVPLAAPLLAIATPVALASSPLRRKQRGRCVSCAYDLTGNVSGVCPECGAKIQITTN